MTSNDASEQVLFLSATYLVGGRGVTQFLFHQSIKIAERKFREMRPNVIVGSNYGAVVALAMDMPRVPMVGKNELAEGLVLRLGCMHEKLRN